MAERSTRPQVVQPRAIEARGEAVERRATYTSRNNLLRSRGARALRIGLWWATCHPDERGKYQTMLGRALRLMIAEGVQKPSRERVERDIDSVLEGMKR